MRTHTHTHKPVIQTELFSTTGELICCCCSHLLDKVNKLLFLNPPPNWNCDCCRDYSYHLFYSNSGPHTCCGEEVEGNNNVILECFKIRIKMLFCREEQVFLLVSFLNLLNPQNSLHQGNACPGFALDLDI